MASKKSSNSQFTRSSLKSLSNEALCKLRDEIAAVLEGRAESLRKQLNRLTGPSGASNGVKAPKLKRVKIAPKYRGPGGKTWGGRGARPRWLSNALEAGHSLEEFLITRDHEAP
ncbi:MAG TPA: H-NS histone family protein [Acidobacteriota bacterium]|nr:H-NS histone family protein [Acidobacteriota bacterium]